MNTSEDCAATIFMVEVPLQGIEKKKMQGGL
jgi:hypothetical protein